MLIPEYKWHQEQIHIWQNVKIWRYRIVGNIEENQFETPGTIN